MKESKAVILLMACLALSVLCPDRLLNAATLNDPQYETAERYLAKDLSEDGFVLIRSDVAEDHKQFEFKMRDGSIAVIKIGLAKNTVLEEMRTQETYNDAKKSTVKNTTIMRCEEGGILTMKADIKEELRGNKVVGKKSRVDTFDNGGISNYSITGENFRYENEKMVRAYEYTSRYDKDNRFLASNSALTEFSYRDEGSIAEIRGELSYFGSDNSLIMSKKEATNYDYWNEGALKSVYTVIKNRDYSRFKKEDVLDKATLRGARYNRNGSLNRTFNATETNEYYDTLFEGARVLRSRKWFGDQDYRQRF